MFSSILAPRVSEPGAGFVAGSIANLAAARGRVVSSIVIAAFLGACTHSSDAIDVATQPTAVIASDSVSGSGDSESIAKEAASVPSGGYIAPRAGLTLPPTMAGLASGNVRHMAPQNVGDTDSPYMLDSGDRIRVFVYGQPNLSRIYAVDGGGFISLPLIGAVKARAETTFDLERAITVQLGSKYVKDPKVSVEIAAYRPFFILGEVRAAGQYPFVTGMTVQTAVAIAGGYSERASERKVVITRRVNGVIDKLRVSPDMVVLPGDTIHIQERFF
jgi:polysaccharide biosynthesis/export protein